MVDELSMILDTPRKAMMMEHSHISERFKRIGDDIRVGRARSRVTLVWLAKEVGITPGTMTAIERGCVMPSPELTSSIAEILGLPVEDLLPDSMTAAA
jgi:DNA-binding XRE family transcriptional regulator